MRNAAWDHEESRARNLVLSPKIDSQFLKFHPDIIMSDAKI